MRIYGRKLWMTSICIAIVLFATNATTYSLKDSQVSAVETAKEETTTVTNNNGRNVSEQKGKKTQQVKKSSKTQQDKINVELYKKNGKKYCKVNGKKAKSQIVQGKYHAYITDKNGAVIKGWTKYKGAYYCLNRGNGRMYKRAKVDGIKLKKDGKAKTTKAAVAKIKTMMKAKKVVDKITKITDTKSQKVKKCFDWIAKAPYVRYRMLKPIYKNQGWEVAFANDIFDKGNGCCVSESSALAFMLHEVGYKKVYVCHDTSHAWVELNGLVYDALFARAKDWNKYYACTYKTFGLHAVGKRMI